MKREAMTIEEFEYGLVRYGARLEEWPAVERQLAKLLLETSDEARRVLDSEHVMNATLDALPGLEPRPMLLNRVFEIPITHERRGKGIGWVWSNFARLGLAFAAMMLCVGGLSGWLSTDDTVFAERGDRAPLDVESEHVDSADTALDEEIAQWEELAEVALADELTEGWP